MVKQALKKGAGIQTKKAKLSAFKEKVGLSDQRVSNANKEQEWILMPKCFQDVTRLPGIPCGMVVSVVGHTNVGKSTLINHAIASAQRQGILPVIIDTENAFSFQYAKNMGFEAEAKYEDVTVEDVDEETGEVTGSHTEHRIQTWDGDFIYYNNHILAECFGDRDYASGTRVKVKRKTAVIEDVTAAINTILDAQEEGEIEQGILFIFDSVGSIGSFKEYKSEKTANAMWAAAAISASFSEIVNNRIPASKKVTSPYTNTLLYINKVWIDSQTSPTAPIMRPKGGNSLKYATRLEILLGGQLTSSIKRLMCTYKSVNHSYAIETKVKILKNHLDAPYNALAEGNLVACDLGFIATDDIDDYKKTHITKMLKEMNAQNKDGHTITEDDVSFTEVESEDCSV
ncbi:MAG: 50S ribosome-binding GTPase [Bacteroidales bacterium]|nr:50S ribosome-binding GTPase [Bacteroidales bacterium]